MKNNRDFPKTRRGQLHIALCVNDSWAQHVAPLVYSISLNHPDDRVIIHLVYRDISEDKLRAIQRLEEVLDNIHLDLRRLSDDALAEISVDDYHLPIESCFRLLLPELLPAVERVIYLDVDTLVCQSLMELWTTDLKGSCIGAVLDLDVQTLLSWHLDRIGYAQGEAYFNSGVLLLDLQQMRERQLSQALLDKAQEWKENLFFKDQDLLNFFFKDEVVYLPAQFNMGMSRLNRYKDGDPLTIVHFNGPEKAWRPLWELNPVVRRYASTYQTLVRRYQALVTEPQPLVSLVVVAEGAGAYLAQCLSSLLSQDHLNLDILVLVADLPEDKRRELADWQTYDDRIRVLDFQPSADFVSLLRSAVHGEYVGFVAVDDFLESGFVSVLLGLAEREQADLVISDYYTLDVERGVFYFHSSNDGTVEPVSAPEAISRQWQPLFAGLWGKLLRRDLLRRLPGTTYAELTLARQAYLISDRLCVLKTAHFCHRLQVPSPPPAAPLRYFQRKIAELESLLADYRLFGFETDWVVQRLAELLHQAVEEVPDGAFSSYLQQKLKQINH